MKKILSITVIFFPWRLKRWVYMHVFGYKIDRSARIGFSYIGCKHLEMEKHSKIGHLNIFIHLNTVILGAYSSIGRGNWITGFTTDNSNTSHFIHQKGTREAKLSIGMHTAITKNHHIDCTNTITVGNYTTIAGYSSQFLTHSIDIYKNRQDSHPIDIGDYCFVGTNCVVLGGATLPNYSVLGAKALLNKELVDTFSLYGGNPAKFVKKIEESALYFQREKGFVN